MIRNIPTITKYLLVTNILLFFMGMFLGQKTGGNNLFNNLFGLHFFLTPDFHLYQLFTYMFMHANWEHIFFNMFGLWMFGCVLERVWGPKKFLIYYIVCGVGAGLFQEAAQLVQFYTMVSEPISQYGWTVVVQQANVAGLSNWTTVGASGAIYAILLAFGMIFPEERIFIFPIPLPIKAKWLVIFYVVLELYFAIATTGDGVAHLAHLGGMFFGFFMIRYWKKHPGDGYGRSQGEQFFDNLRSAWEQRTKKTADSGRSARNSHTATNVDWDYNARKRQEEAEIDRILDKIRKNGYDSLTSEEKRKLFDQKR